MSTETCLNDRWSRFAQQQIEERDVHVASPTARVTGPKRPEGRAPETPGLGSAARIAGLTPDEVKRLAAKFSVANVSAADKNGVAATAAAGVVSVWLEVTPDMAARWLKTNFRNRAVSADTVAAYARDMAAGRWQPTHQGLAFNDHDQLIDGQHRLKAVLRFGRPVRMMVTFGLPSKIAGSEMTTMDCVDRGRTRTVADQLKIEHGLKHGAQISGICAALGHLCVGEKLRRLSVGQTLDIYRAFQPGVDHVIEHRNKAAGLKAAGVLAAFAFAWHVKAADAEERYRRFTTGDSGTGVPPVRSGPLSVLRALVTGEQSALLIYSLQKGVAELTAWAIWTDMFRPEATALSQAPEEWLKAVDYFRAQQVARIGKIAALFKLPE